MNWNLCNPSSKSDLESVESLPHPVQEQLGKSASVHLGVIAHSGELNRAGVLVPILPNDSIQHVISRHFFVPPSFLSDIIINDKLGFVNTQFEKIPDFF